MWRYQPPLFPFGQGVFLVLLLAAIGVALLLLPRRKRVLLGIGILIAAWQGGIWLGYIQMDFTVFHLILLSLLTWNLSERNDLKQWKAYIRPVLLPWGLMIAWSIVSVSGAISPDQARQGPARFVFDMLFFLAVITTVKSVKDFRFVIMALAAAVIGQSILAMLQFKFPGITFGVIDQVRTHMWWRARGTLRHPNHLGMIMVLLLPLMVRGVIHGMTARDKKLIRICSVATLFGGVAILTTYNRGAWVGLAAGFFVMIIIDMMGKGGKIKRVAGAIFAAGVLVAIVGTVEFGEFIMTRLFHDDQEEIMEGREQLQEQGIETVKNHPIFGVGYSNQKFYSNVAFVHNLYVLIPAEIGLPGMAFFIWFFLEFFRMVIKGVRSKIAFIHNYSRGLVASLVGFSVASIPGPDFWINDGVQIYFWSCLAVMVCLRRIQVGMQKQKKQKKTMKKVTDHGPRVGTPGPPQPTILKRNDR